VQIPVMKRWNGVVSTSNRPVLSRSRVRRADPGTITGNLSMEEVKAPGHSAAKGGDDTESIRSWTSQLATGEP
jgi:hypothetical protein